MTTGRYREVKGLDFNECIVDEAGGDANEELSNCGKWEFPANEVGT